ncbi:MAG: hypothetical protein ACREF5_03290, partial [Candidatus Saccharimonadales bacterium]
MIKLLKSITRNDFQNPAKKRGYILIAVLWISIVLTLIGFALLSGGTNEYLVASDGYYSINALYTAEA